MSMTTTNKRTAASTSTDDGMAFTADVLKLYAAQRGTPRTEGHRVLSFSACRDGQHTNDHKGWRVWRFFRAIAARTRMVTKNIPVVYRALRT
jgi:hypothetical protein